MQPRRTARELALLSLSQLSGNKEKVASQQMSNLIMAAIRTLTSEVRETLEVAAAEVQRGSDRLLTSETRASDVSSAKAMLSDAIELTQAAINRLGTAVELPEFVQMANQHEVRAYALEILSTVNSKRTEIDDLLTEALVDWQLNRLPKIDRDILRIAVGEIMFLGVPDSPAINEAVELAKKYSDEEGRKFINGVLRRVTEKLKTKSRTWREN